MSFTWTLSSSVAPLTRIRARARLATLFDDDPYAGPSILISPTALGRTETDEHLQPAFGSLTISSLVLGALAVCVSSPAVSWTTSLLLGGGAATLPGIWRRRAVKQRAAGLARDYPTILLAIASSLRAGLSIHEALQRSVALLPHSSVSRSEIEALVRRLQERTSREQSVHMFARGIDVPEVELFRLATLIALEHGGSLGTTLERLACIASERRALIEAARVSTANMRMTANILLGLTPLLVATQLSRSPEMLQQIMANTTARSIASGGLALILGGFCVLRKLSDFKP